MFDFSFGELTFIALVALLVVGPKNLPTVIHTLGRWAGQFKTVADEFKSGFKEVMRETSLHEMQEHADTINEEAKFIRDQQGKLQRTYDISDFLDERSTMKTNAELPKTNGGE